MNCPICGTEMNCQDDYSEHILMASSESCPRCNYSHVFDTGSHEVTLSFMWGYHNTPQDKKMIELLERTSRELGNLYN